MNTIKPVDSFEVVTKMARDFRILVALRSKERANIPLTLAERARLVVLKERREQIKLERLAEARR